MVTSLKDAPIGKPLVVVGVHNEGLARELAKLGITHGRELIRLEEEVALVQPVRLRGPWGEVILSANMAAGLVVHLDDGRIAPLMEMEPGEKGHLEGVTCLPSSALAETYRTLELNENDPVQFDRRLPSMEYVTLVNRKSRISLPGGMAAKLWGESGGQKMQFAAIGAGKEFALGKILGGPRSRERITGMGLVIGDKLVLEAVKPAETICLTKKDPIAVATPGNLRFWLPPKAAALLSVRLKSAGPDAGTPPSAEDDGA